MDLTTSLLCEYAQVREGVLFVSSGGVTRMWSPEVPVPLNLCLALVVEHDQIEAERPHELHILLQGEDGARFADIQGGYQVSGRDLDVGEKINVPLTFDLRSVELPSFGRYDVAIYVDGGHKRTLSFKVGPPPPTSREADSQS